MENIQIEEDFMEWEEWNPQHGSFMHHVISGSIAGVVEHTIMFPVDTIKVFITIILFVLLLLFLFI